MRDTMSHLQRRTNNRPEILAGLPKSVDLFFLTAYNTWSKRVLCDRILQIQSVQKDIGRSLFQL